MPITRSRLNFDSLNAAWAMASSGFETTIRIAFGEFRITLPTTSDMIL